MSDLVLEHLKAIPAKLAQMERNDRETVAELISLRTMMGEFIKTDARRDAHYLTLEARVDRIERRLQLADPSHDQR
jgi:hypothetical protein